MNLQLAARRALVVIVILAASEFAPGPVNWFLIIVLIGMILSRWDRFKFVLEWMSAITGDESESGKESKK